MFPQGDVDREARVEILSFTPMPQSRVVPLIRCFGWMALLLILIPAFARAQGNSSKPSTMPRSQKQESRREIDLLEERWREAVLKSDAAAMEPLLADDYIAISASGTLETKEQTLENIRKGKVHFSRLDLSDRKVRFYGATALVTSRADVVATTHEGDISGSSRYTRVYVRDKQGAWKIVSFEVSQIRKSK
jgi:ketosteroid isomerase-like protein